jgi:co-chaperonin GroES (HSP10)
MALVARAATPMNAMKHDVDPAQQLLQMLGRLPRKVCGGRIFAASYVRPDQMTVKGGHTLYLPDKTRDEDIWQGKAHFVVMVGAEAYRNDSRRDFAEPYCQVGDWIVITPQSGRMIAWNGVPCRIIEDADVQMVIDAPDTVY